MANAEQEPTMEEILASIRRIINEDEEEAAPAEAEAASAETESEPESDMDGDQPQAEAEAEAEPQAEDAAADDDFGDNDDVLELTERVEDEMSGTDPMSISDDLMIVDREDEPEEPELEAEPEAEPEPQFEAEPEPQPAPAADDDSLLGDVQSSAASSAFAALSENLRVSSEQGLTLEGIVREMLRPMLKQWLDENLPSIVEEKVQAEIERVARRRH